MAAGAASLYVGVIEAMVVDSDDPNPGPEDLSLLTCPTLMDGAAGRRQVAERVLDFARKLS